MCIVTEYLQGGDLNEALYDDDVVISGEFRSDVFDCCWQTLLSNLYNSGCHDEFHPHPLFLSPVNTDAETKRLHILTSIAKGVEYLHRKGIIHRFGRSCVR